MQDTAEEFRRLPADQGDLKAQIRAEIKCRVVDFSRSAKYRSPAFRPEGELKKI